MIGGEVGSTYLSPRSEVTGPAVALNRPEACKFRVKKIRFFVVVFLDFFDSGQSWK